MIKLTTIIIDDQDALIAGGAEDLADTLSGLKVVHRVRKIVVRVGIVHQLVQLLDDLLDRVLAVAEAEPFLVHGLNELYGLILVHKAIAFLLS